MKQKDQRSEKKKQVQKDKVQSDQTEELLDKRLSIKQMDGQIERSKSNRKFNIR